MKTIIIFNENDSKYSKSAEFSGKFAVELSEEWGKILGYEIYKIKAQNVTELFTKLSETATKNNADAVIYSYEDCPFLDIEITKKLLDSHYEYKSEYTFADGYPYGFAPEIIDAGTLRILCELSKTTQEAEGKKSVNRESVFNLIKTDINSFDVESILAPQDWRLFRFAFHCGTKDNFLQCKNLFDAANGEKNIDKLSEIASKTTGCLKTVPGFYNIQIAGTNGSTCIYEPELPKTEQMSYENFEKLVDQIAEFSENAVIGLSAWGEPFENPECIKMIEKVLCYEGLSVFLETDGLKITDEICAKIGQIVNSAKERTNGWQKIMIAVKIDSFTAQTYSKIHKNGDFSTAVSAVSKLSGVIPGMVYPQFVRMNENEEELEGFYRYWNEKSNASGGNQIIQKYDSLAGTLPQRKVADLSPIDRNICWHLRRDLTILSNGNVPSCRACLMSVELGNVFSEKLVTIWQKTDLIIEEQIKQKYNEKCRNCDEFYTFWF